MDRIVEKSMLYDFYGELLTAHQKEVYGEYIQNDLSVSELAALLGISRQGAHDMVKRCEKILSDYEDRLHLVAHYATIKGLVGKIREYSGEIIDCEDRDLIGERVKKIAEISNRILEEY